MKEVRQETIEWLACSRWFAYWLDSYGSIYDATARGWTPFRLWPAQARVADALQTQRLIVILKARQLGMSWLCVAYALWMMLFRPAATILLFSKRDDEARDLLSNRLVGMYRRLPEWMQARAVVVDNGHEFRLSNGSAALAFPTTGGRSYTASLAVVDEADHMEDLEALLDAVKPTVDAGGQLVLVSTANKRRSGTAFKRIYEAAKRGENGYWPAFLPWSARPDRDAEWYEAQRRDVLARSGTLDGLFQEYPATDVEALAGLSSDRRFPAAWLSAVDGTMDGGRPTADGGELMADGLRSAVGGPWVAFEAAEAGRWYLIGADPAEGNPQSDESAACVCDAMTGTQVAVLAGRFEPRVFAAHLMALSDAYSAGVLVERNNHGHAVLLWLAEQGFDRVLRGLDGRPGWLTTGRGKALAVEAAAETLREGAAAGRALIRDRETMRQLMALRGATLAAPAGDHDDRALAWILAQAAARYCEGGGGESGVIPPLEEVGSGW